MIISKLKIYPNYNAWIVLSLYNFVHSLYSLWLFMTVFIEVIYWIDGNLKSRLPMDILIFQSLPSFFNGGKKLFSKNPPDANYSTKENPDN